MGFTRRITPALAKIVYAAVMVLAGLTTLLGVLMTIGMFATASDSFIGGGSWIFYGIVTLVLSPLTGFLVLAFGRFLLEFFVDRAAELRGPAGR